jgi:hypothetical protein
VNLNIAVLDKPRADTIESSNSRFTHLNIFLLRSFAWMDAPAGPHASQTGCFVRTNVCGCRFGAPLDALHLLVLHDVTSSCRSSPLSTFRSAPDVFASVVPPWRPNDVNGQPLCKAAATHPLAPLISEPLALSLYERDVYQAIHGRPSFVWLSSRRLVRLLS